MPSPDPKNRMISKIHVAKKSLAMRDDDYRAFLQRVTGKTSSRDLTLAQLSRVLTELKALGFKPKPPKAAAGRKLADDPQARKIRALWITLHQMGEVKDPSEAALASFAKRTSGVSDLHWIGSAEADRLIKALRGWISRAGGDPDDY